MSSTVNTSELPQIRGPSQAESKLRLRTKLAFAVVTALGGMLVGTGEETGAFAVVVVFFAFVGFLFVDWQRFFSLPPAVAYVAMAITAVVCVAEFVEQSGMIGQKMVAVAQLLAAAQAILMLQEKSQRLFEQLLIFSLLNCVVASVFNDAFNYAIWFIPLTVAIGIGLGFLVADQTVQSIKTAGRSATPDASRPRWDNRVCVEGFAKTGRRLPFITGLILFPAVVGLAAAFFFALPRRVEAKRGQSAEAIVGFSDKIQLGQIGKMQQSRTRALRVSLKDADTKETYAVNSDLYLRGHVFESYRTRGDNREAEGTWRSESSRGLLAVRALPAQHVDRRQSDLNLYDRIHVEVVCEASRETSVFGIAPYHRVIGSQTVVHRPLQWTLSRRDTDAGINKWQPRVEYRFGTHAFRDGEQTRWIANASDSSLEYRDNDSDEDLLFGPSNESLSTEDDSSPLPSDSFSPSSSAAELDYLDLVSDYPRQWVPTAGKIADRIVSEIPSSSRNTTQIAERLTEYLASGQDYSYTLNLTFEQTVGMDPLEQFLSVDRSGHCQYFAAALVMMLRSQDIPARLVVGYRCDEFNELGQYFLVRQSHAHAWVEALIDRDEIPMGNNLAGQPRSKDYWLRLDPTPGGGGVPESAELTGRQVVDLAKNLWTDYVVEMDPQRQRSTLMAAPGMAPMTASYRNWIDGVKDFATRINSGEISGLEAAKLFSVPAAVVVIVFGAIGIMLFKFRLPSWIRNRLRQASSQKAPPPSVPFYAETLELLTNIGVSRSKGQTPVELIEDVQAADLRPTCDALTKAFYEARYADRSPTEEQQIESWLAVVRQKVHGKRK